MKDYSLLLSAADYSMGGFNHESLASLTTTRTTNNSDDNISLLSEQEQAFYLKRENGKTHC
jgi:hypothetical protein